MCPYCQVTGRQEDDGRPRRNAEAARKISHPGDTLALRPGHDVNVGARPERGGVPEILLYSQPVARPAEPARSGFDAGCAFLSAQYDGLCMEVQLTRGAMGAANHGASDPRTANGVYCTVS